MNLIIIWVDTSEQVNRVGPIVLTAIWIACIAVIFLYGSQNLFRLVMDCNSDIEEFPPLSGSQ